MNILSNLKNNGIQLNDMQWDAYDAIKNGDGNVVILSPTGSGKTLAYLCPVLEQIIPDIQEIQAVVLVPSRELAEQSARVLSELKTPVRACSLHGGRPTMDEHRAIMKRHPQILFATPGRLKDHLQKENFTSREVKWLVIDEFDKCLEMGFISDMMDIVKLLSAVERKILLSATEAEEIPRFVDMGKTTRIDYISNKSRINNRTSLYTVHCPEKDKLHTLNKLLCSLGNQSSIVFLNYRESVERVSKYLAEQGFCFSYYHGGLDQKQRERQLYKFSNASTNILVSTDLASRGLDIPDVDNIINYHLPENINVLIHRIGRTARWQQEGKSFLLLGPEESIPDDIGPTENYIIPEDDVKPAKPKMATLYIGKGKKDKISKGDIVGFLCKTSGLTSKDIGRIDVLPYYAYAAIDRTLLKQALQLTKGEKIKGLRTVVEEIE